MDIKLSSFKRDHGLKELLSSSLEDFWHTDDNLPHYISITFKKLTYVSSIQMKLQYSFDESYTPQSIEIKASRRHDRIEKDFEFNLEEPEGVVTFDLGVECFFLHVIVLKNHHDGKDTHMRGFKVFDENSIEICPRSPFIGL